MKKYVIYGVVYKGTWHVRYVGVTTRSLQKRWTEHKTSKLCRILHNAIKAYGPGAFEIVPLASAFDVDAASFVEAALIEQWDTLRPNGYNLTTGGEGHYTRSQETRERMRIPNSRPKSDEHKANLSAAHKGKTLSPEHRAKVGRPGRPQSPELRAKRAAAQVGRVMSPETRAKISAANKGVNRNKPVTEEARAKRREVALKEWDRRKREGMTVSLETRTKQSEAQRERWQRVKQEGFVVSPETRARMRASQQKRWQRRKTEKADV